MIVLDSFDYCCPLVRPLFVRLNLPGNRPTFSGIDRLDMHCDFDLHVLESRA